ncbi:MAG: peroxiredoxin [Betaproteobacteria bacterium]|jgi:peroxiredoxin Q/BCP|nr:peroxiredoxin [Betaproteobacteria bacterium]HAB48440.1 peroxiredoxin [Lautropia sp.]NBP34688.1 peroxiredoxin [Betaproteobacteria bacterium]NBP37430.1 peroxiredoxin [Betaproteobacteria bacterium]NBQ78527.1 peroxiredoxin [Betaproteobacteria bacterium]
MSETQSPEQQSPNPGQSISPFEADSTAGRFSSAELQQTLVLYFYPKDNTPGCTTQSMDFRDHHDAFVTASALVVGVSRDSLKSHENFKKKYELPFALISDPDEALCTQFGVMKNKTMYGKPVRGIERSTFVISKQGELLKVWRGVKIPGHVAEVLEFVKSI